MIDLAESVGKALFKDGVMMAAAESCTGGWIAQVVTSVPGSSQWFERGFVTYTNASKQELLGVASATLAAHGAVSEAVVKEMVSGALQNSAADIAVAVSGIAGPDGGSPEKPVGTVWLAWQKKGGNALAAQFLFQGDRQQVREQAVRQALQGVIELLQ